MDNTSPTPGSLYPLIDAHIDSLAGDTLSSNTTADTLVTSAEVVESRLIAAVAAVLDLPSQKITPIDSFADLGGDHSKARALRKRCAVEGMALEEEDILRCKTIAELETYITPCEPIIPSPTVEECTVSPLHPHSVSGSVSSSATGPQHSRSSSQYSNMSSASNPQTPPPKDPIEAFLSKHEAVDRCAITTPMAGLLEDKRLCVLTLTGVSSPEASELPVSPAKPQTRSPPKPIQLIPQSQMFFAGAQIAAIKQALEVSPITEPHPDIWIVVESLPLNHETADIDRRKLRTWSQNVNEATVAQIMSLDTSECSQAPVTDMERSLQRLVALALQLTPSQVGMNFSFVQLGGDEATAKQLVSRAKLESIYLNSGELMKEGTTLEELANVAAQRGVMTHKWTEESFAGSDLSPMQNLYFLTGMGGDSVRRAAGDGRYRFNQSLLLKIKKPFTAEDIAAAVEAVVAHHAMLRARFTKTPLGWTQRVEPEIAGSYTLTHHTISTDDDLENVIERTQASIDIEAGPVFAVDHFHASGGHQMIYIIAHHLVVDLLSWRLIIQDLDELLENGSLLSQRSMPMQQWIEVQKEMVKSIEPDTLAPPGPPGDYAYWGLQDAPNTYKDTLEYGFTLSHELTAALQEMCNRVFRTDSADIYLAALLLAFSQTFTDRKPPVIWNQEHGRQLPSSSTDDLDITETVGWFTTMCPVGQKFEAGHNFIEVLRRLKDTRRAGAKHSSAYFASKFFSDKATSLFSSDWPFEIIFSYAGSLQQLERGNGLLEQLTIPRRTIASRTSDIGADVSRLALFEIVAVIDQGAAKIKFLWNRHSQHQELIAGWIQAYEQILLEGINTLRHKSEELTLADVPHLDVTYAGLAKLNHERVAALHLTSVRDIEDVFPVTATQQSILISQAKTPEACHLHTIYDFASPNGDPVDIARLCAAWQHVVNKYATLRTLFIDSVTETGLYDQVILRKCSPHMLFLDASPGEDPIELLTALPAVPGGVNQSRHRLTVCKAAVKTFLKLDVSEALVDAPSIHNIIADLRRAYASNKPLPELTGFSYSTYLRFLEKARSSDSLAFWSERLKPIQPCRFPVLAVQNEHTQPARVHFELEIDTKNIIDFGSSNSLSTETVLRLAWGLVLRAFCGTNNVCFGYRATGREATSGGPPMRGAVGSFANTLPCHMELAHFKSLAAVLRSSDDAYNACLPHQHVSTAEMYHALGIKGSDALFNSCLSYTSETQDLNSKFTTRASFELRNIYSQQTSQYELAVNVRSFNQALVVDIFSTLMDDGQALNLANSFGRAIKSVLGAPNGSIGGVDLFSDRDYAQIIAWGNEAQADPTDPTAGQSRVLHDIINRRGADNPDAPAVCAWDGELSYRQMEQYATMLAHHLVEAGVGPRVIVPVVLEKSQWAPVVLLAVLKAGGAFVPIDSQELGLLQPIFEQLDSKIAISVESTASVLSNLFEKVIPVSTALMEGFRLPETKLPNMATADDLACIFFAPVSSRDVKGLAFTHDALTTAFTAQGPAADISSRSRVMQLSSFNVDIALSELFATLVHGGCICIPSAGDRTGDYTGAVDRLNVNWSYMTPLLARKLIVDQLPKLKTVCFRTRTLDEDSWQPWSTKKKVIFAYGAPDICPLGISFLEVFGPQQLNRVGKPLAGSFWIVNPEDHRKLMPMGAIGELVIEGPTLGCDYSHGRVDQTHWNTADFNSSRNIKTKYFKTGHRVRYTEGGCMEIISSKAEDLNINGRVINLTEVEQNLRRCLGRVDVMAEAIAFRGAKSTPVLAAFIELGTLFDGPEDLKNLSSTTKERLYVARQLVETALRNEVPAYMIPSIFIPVKHLPVTPSLKVNRRRLQKRITGLSKEQLIALSAVSNPTQVQTLKLKPLPLTEAEERMRNIWASVLKIEASTIGAADGFVRAGGDDVLATLLVAECRKQGIVINIGDVLRNATLTELCRSMAISDDREPTPPPMVNPTIATAVDDMSSPSQQSHSSPADGTPRLSPPPTHGFDNPSPVSEVLIAKVLAPKVGVERKLIKEVAEATSMQTRYIESGMLRGRANINYFVFSFTGTVNSKKLEEACQMLATIHPILRTAFVPHNRKVYQVVLKGYNQPFKRYASPAFRVATLTEKMVRKDQGSPIAFSSPMTKFMFFDGGKQSTLVLRLSRAQYDDQSIALMVKELKKLYDGTQNPPRRVTYCEFVRCAEMSNAQGQAEEYWRQLLAGANMTQVVAHQKPYQLTSTARTIVKSMSIGDLSKLGINFETVLKSAWAMVLAALSGNSDIVFGELIEGRHLRLRGGQSVSGVLGPTCNTIPVRVIFPEQQLSPLDLLNYIHTQRAAGIPFENLGFLDLIERCTPWSYWTRFSTVVQHRFEETALIPEETKTFHLGSASCKFTTFESAAQDVPDLLVRSIMRGANKVELSITFCEARVPLSIAEEAGRRLSETIQLLTSAAIMQPVVPAGSQYLAMAPQIPLPHSFSASPTSELNTATRMELDRVLGASDALAIQTLISNAWAAVLEPQRLGVPDQHRHNAAFYDLWGSLIPAAQLAAYLSKELPRLNISRLDKDTVVTMEEIVEHPTMLRQFELIARKMKVDVGAAAAAAAAVAASPGLPAHSTAGSVHSHARSHSNAHSHTSTTGPSTTPTAPTPSTTPKAHTRSNSGSLAVKEKESSSSLGKTLGNSIRRIRSSVVPRHPKHPTPAPAPQPTTIVSPITPAPASTVSAAPPQLPNFMFTPVIEEPAEDSPFAPAKSPKPQLTLEAGRSRAGSGASSRQGSHHSGRSGEQEGPSPVKSPVGEHLVSPVSPEDPRVAQMGMLMGSPK